MSKHAGRPTKTQMPSPRRGRSAWYALIVIVVLGTATWLLRPDLAGKFDHHSSGNVLALEAAMDGFSVRQIEAKVGQPVTV